MIVCVGCNKRRMMKRTILLSIALFVQGICGISIAYISAQEIKESSIIPEITSEINVLIEGNTAFTLDLYNTLNGHGGNLILSPFSLSMALGMTYAGVRGESASQMKNVLHFDLEQDRLHPAFKNLIDNLFDRQKPSENELKIANALWCQKGIKLEPSFLDLVNTCYRAPLKQVDFKSSPDVALRTINNWIRHETGERIEELIPSGMINSDTDLVLGNAIYFKGKWAIPFNKRLTQEATFILGYRKTVPVQMMHQTGEYGFLETPELKILELPYLGDELSMILFLPNQLNGLSAIEKLLTTANIKKWLSNIHQREVELYLPKFNVLSAFRLDEMLKSLGMTDLFKKSGANFSGMLQGSDVEGPIHLQAIIHKAFVGVDEVGTEATAFSAVTVAVECMSIDESVVFRADHPFIFLIRDKLTETILFFGRVTNPQKDTFSNGEFISYPKKSIDTDNHSTVYYITKNIKSPEIIKKINPVHPYSDIKLQQYGIVIIDAVISKEGRVKDAIVVKSMSPEYDQAAINAAEKWKFEPAIRNSNPVDVYMTLGLQFKPEESE